MNCLVALGDDWPKFYPGAPGLDAASLRITRNGTFQITRPHEADQISRHIIAFCELLRLPEASQLTVTDGTAGCGGNVISLCKHFGRVIAVEKDELHHRCLAENLETYGLRDVRTLHADYTEVFMDLSQHVVLLDCPWSDDVWYTRKRDLMLHLSDVPVFALARDLLLKTDTQVVAIKAPQNFGFGLFFRKLPFDLLVKVCRVYTYYLILVRRDRPTGASKTSVDDDGWKSAGS